MENKEKSPVQRLLTKMKQSDLLVLIVALLVLCVIMGILSPVFFSTRNIMNTLRQVSLTGICGFGLVLIILSGEIDLSVGSQQAVAGIVSITVLNSTKNIGLAVLAALLSGVIVGGINGILVTKGKLNSMIVTLGTMTTWRGVCMVITGAISIPAEVEGFQNLATGYIGPFPNAFIIAAILFVVIFILLNHTTFGRYLYAIGGNKEAARLSGLPVDQTKIIVYVIGSVLAMLSGILLASRMSSGQPTAGTGFEMTVIASVILGGISLSGGIGSIQGALLGMLILGVLENGLTLFGVSSFWQDILRGIVIILAVYVDGLRKETIAKKLIKEQKKQQM